MATFILFKKFLQQQFGNAAVDFDTDDVRVMLITAGAGAPNVSETGAQYLSDVVAGNPEVTAGGSYVAGGVATNSVLTLSAVGLSISTANPTWAQDPAAPTNARYALVYKNTGVSSTSPVIAYLDLGGIIDLTSASLTINVTNSELMTVS